MVVIKKVVLAILINILVANVYATNTERFCKETINIQDPAQPEKKETITKETFTSEFSSEPEKKEEDSGDYDIVRKKKRVTTVELSAEASKTPVN
jgi:hypothetical protein